MAALISPSKTLTPSIKYASATESKSSVLVETHKKLCPYLSSLSENFMEIFPEAMTGKVGTE